jgi:hypothetical protein
MVPHVIPLLHLVLFAHTTAAPIPILDGRVVLKSSPVSPDDVALLRRKALPDARKAAGKDCEESFDPKDVATGSFTRAGANQKIILYEYCEFGHGSGRSGLAVLEGGKVVAHIAFVGGGEFAVRMLPDLDGDGKGELAITSAFVAQGEMEGSAVLLSWSAKGVRKLGRLDVVASDCGQEDGTQNHASQFLAIPGPTPTFLEQRYVGSCEGKTWTKKGARAAAVLGEDGIEYQVLTSTKE